MCLMMKYINAQKTAESLFRECRAAQTGIDADSKLSPLVSMIFCAVESKIHDIPEGSAVVKSTGCLIGGKISIEWDRR